MAEYYAYTPRIWPPLLVTVLAAVLVAHAWRQRQLPGAQQLAFAALFAMLWVGGSVAEEAAIGLTTKVWWYKFQVSWQVPCLTAIACFTFEYAWPGRWLTRRNLLLLSIAPVVSLVSILTDDRYHTMWLSLTSEGVVAPVRGALNWLLVAYILVIALLQFGAITWLFVRSPQHRWPAAIIMFSLIANRAGYVLRATAPDRGQGLSASVMVGMSSLAFAVALFGFRILDPVAQAQWTAITQMRDGMLVLDPHGRVVRMNPAARKVLGVSLKDVSGQPGQSLFPAAFSVEKGFDGTGQADISVGTGSATRDLQLAASDLKDWRGVAVGRLIMLRDVTIERQSQAQIVQQQRSLATLQERDRLARELHDSLGQTLAAAHLQASTARLLLDQCKISETDKCLERLAEMTLDAEVDVREYILGTRTFSAGGPFFEALRQYVLRFGHHYGIRTELCVPLQLEERGLDATVETQLFRIIQEALSNARKHAQAGSCQVAFTVSGSLLQVAVSDDGKGLDPAAVAARHGEGYGLQTMRERVESLGGFLEVTSQPGQGTRVLAHVTLEELNDDE